MLKRAAAAVLILGLLNGCTAEPAPVTAPAVPPPPAVTTAASSPAASPTPATCKDTKGWSADDTLSWVRQQVTYKIPGNVELGTPGRIDFVCKPIGLQVQFWNVKVSTALGTVSYVMPSSQRKQISFDGRRPMTVKTPNDLQSTDCGGFVMAVYTGAPLTDDELPESIDFSGLKDVKFRSDRVAYVFSQLPPADTDFSSKCRQAGYLG